MKQTALITIIAASVVVGAVGGGAVVTTMQRRPEEPSRQPSPASSPTQSVAIPVAETKRSEGTPTTVASEVERLRQQLQALIDRGEAQTKESRLACERAGVGMATLLMFDQMARCLQNGNAAGADATFNADVKLRIRAQTLYSDLRRLYLEEIPQAHKALADAERAAEERRLATDPEYRAEVERQKTDAAAVAKADAEKRAADVAVIKELASGIPAPEGHPLRGVVKTYCDAYEAALANYTAPPHKRPTLEQIEQFADERVKALQSVQKTSGVTSWAIAANKWMARYKQDARCYTVDFAVGPTALPLTWTACQPFDASVIAEAIGDEKGGGWTSYAGVMLAAAEPIRQVRNGHSWWQVLRMPWRDQQPMLWVEMSFDPRDNDILGGIKQTQDEGGMFVFSIEGSYGEWCGHTAGNAAYEAEEGIGEVRSVLVDVCQGGKSPSVPKLQVAGCRLTALRYVARDGAITALVSAKP